MHRYLPLVAASFVLAFGLASGARALTSDDLRCQSAIGEAGREFAAARLKTIVACRNMIVGGDACDTARPGRVIAEAEQALFRRILAACSDAALADLGFPGTCVDASGGSFVVDDVATCLRQRGIDATDRAVAFEYPELHVLIGNQRRCQRGLARAGSAFIAENMRIRTRCLDARLAGMLPETVDCRAEVDPYGLGTADARTDRAVMHATARLFSRIAEACFRADLGALGFPASCPPVLGDLSVDDVQRCVRATHQESSTQMLDAEYPPSPTATPIATPSPTPLPVSFSIAPKFSVRAVGGVQNYNVTGHYADGSARNLTQRMEYFSSDASVGVAPNELGNRGRVNVVGVGTTFVTASDPTTGLTTDTATMVVTTCAHFLCSTGAALDPTCHPCVASICAADPSCCTDGWSQACLDAVASTCSFSCPPPAN